MQGQGQQPTTLGMEVLDLGFGRLFMESSMKVSDVWDTHVTDNRLDWNAIKSQIDVAKIATALFGPAPGRRGERGRRLWWRCPFHEDKNPSLGIEPGKPWWRCFGCGEHGDAAS